MIRFHGVHDKLTQTLDDLPDELCISDEFREQVCFFTKLYASLLISLYFFV